MCNTVAILGGLLSAAQTGLQVQAQSQAAKAQARANAAAARSVRDATIANYAELERRRTQEREAASEELTALRRRELKRRERARVSAGEAGVAGLSVDALLRDFYGQEAFAAETVRNSFANRSTQIDAELEQTRRGARSRLGALAEPQGPDLGAALVSLGGTALDAVNAGLAPQAAASAPGGGVSLSHLSDPFFGGSAQVAPRR